MQRCFQFKLLDALKIHILSSISVYLVALWSNKKENFLVCVFDLVQSSPLDGWHHIIFSQFSLWNILLAYFCQEFLFYFIVFNSLSSRPLCLQQKLSLTLRYQMYILYQLCISFMSSLAENKWVLGGIHQGLKLLCSNSSVNQKTMFSNSLTMVFFFFFFKIFFFQWALPTVLVGSFEFFIDLLSNPLAVPNNLQCCLCLW